MYFGYDPLGRCVKRWVSPSSNFFLGATYMYYDGWSIIQEGDNVSSPTRLYVQGNRVDELEVTFNVVTSQYGFHQYDARGHCILTTDISGNMMEEYDYDAWGKPHFYSGSSWWSWDLGYSEFGNRFLFTGREWLSDLGVYDYRNRLYHPELGRFLQPDPKEFAAGDYNLYRYCHNDPVNKNDPFGLDPVFVSSEEAAFAYQGDLKDLAAFNTAVFLGIFHTYEFGTTVYRDSQGALSLSQTKTDYDSRNVNPAYDSRKTSVIETHNHIHDGNNEITHSKLSDRDVTRGNQTGHTQEVITPNGTTDRYRPSDNASERRAGTGGIIERRDANGNWHRLPGANTNLKNRLDAQNGY